MRDVFSLEPKTKISDNNSYVDSYPYMIEYFLPITSFEAGDVVRGAHMIYGWMPTILTLHSKQGKSDLDVAAMTLTKAKAGIELSDNEIEALAALVNNSLVGASKLLHFVAPVHFPIWDSKVYSFVYEERPHHYRVNSIKAYRQYVAKMKELAKEPQFPAFHDSVQKKLGYNVSPLRSLEIVMFNAPNIIISR